MAVGPPFARGTGGWCGCDCGCCPPLNTFDTVYVEYEVGTPNNAPLMIQATKSTRARNAPEPVDFPDFDHEPISSDERFVFALAGGGCSVPIEPLTATITTTGFGMELNAGVIYAVGDGIVSVVVDPTSFDTSCGEITGYINGVAGGTFVADGQVIDIVVESEDPVCCEVVETARYGGGGAPLMMRQRATALAKGTKQGTLKVNQDALLQKLKMRQARITRSKPTSEPPTTSP